MAGQDTRGRFCRQNNEESSDDTVSDDLSCPDTDNPRKEGCGERVVVDHNYVGGHCFPGITMTNSCQTSLSDARSLARKKVKPDVTYPMSFEPYIPLMYSNMIQMQCRTLSVDKVAQSVVQVSMVSEYYII